jgi:hypothetical protein
LKVPTAAVRDMKSTLRMCTTPLLKSLDDKGPAPLLALDQTMNYM